MVLQARRGQGGWERARKGEKDKKIIIHSSVQLHIRLPERTKTHIPTDTWIHTCARMHAHTCVRSRTHTQAHTPRRSFFLKS